MASHRSGPRLMPSGTLEGDAVVNSAGENLGSIKDFMLNMETGTVEYAVLSFGGILGMGEKLFAVPFQALQLDPENHQFVLDVDKERLKSAPGFDRNDWPDTANPEWGSRVRSFYGIP